MPIPDPIIDDRDHRRIFEEARARIAVHTPEWTNTSDADPGITILQLFAFMVESMLYRANRVPERHRLAFLRLLGVGLRPAEPARGIVSFSNPRAPLPPVTIRAGTELLAGRTAFRTVDEVSVLPLEAYACTKRRPVLSGAARERTMAVYAALYEGFAPEGGAFAIYETTPLQPPRAGEPPPVLDLDADTVDGCLWVALLARTPDLVGPTRDAVARQWLTIAITPDLAGDRATLAPDDDTLPADAPGFIVEVPAVDPARPGAPPEPRYRPVDTIPITDPASGPAIIRVSLPAPDELATWADLDPIEAGVGGFPPPIPDDDAGARVVTWLRIRCRASDDPARTGLDARIGHVAVNAARITQRLRAVAEPLGTGTGEPDQSFTLANTPVIVDEALRLTVGGEVWRVIDDLGAAGPEVPGASPAPDDTPSRVFTVDRESGVIRFGDGLRGARPPRGAVIAASYDHGGGLDGLVPIGAIAKGPSLPLGIRVANPLPTWGASEAESVDQAERSIPARIRHRDRAVTGEDFADIVRQTPGVRLGRVEVLPLTDPEMPDVRVPGVVTVLVVPDAGPDRPHPSPDRLFLEAVCRYLEPRRLITTRIHVIGPVYVPLRLSVGIEPTTGRDPAAVARDVRTALGAFLSPTGGGFDASGWPLGRDVDAAELLTVAARVPGVSTVRGVSMADDGGRETDRVEIGPISLPMLAALSVRLGRPDPASTLGATPAAGGPIALPIPIVPDAC